MHKLFSRRAGLAAGLILACYAPAIFFDALIEKSILDLFLLSCLLFLLLGLIDNEKWRKWLAPGAISGLLGLSRENALDPGAGGGALDCALLFNAPLCASRPMARFVFRRRAAGFAAGRLAQS